jgi:hypothetical protein
VPDKIQRTVSFELLIQKLCEKEEREIKECVIPGNNFHTESE